MFGTRSSSLIRNVYRKCYSTRLLSSRQQQASPVQVTQHTTIFAAALIPAGLMAFILASLGPSHDKLDEELLERYGDEAEIIAQNNDKGLEKLFSAAVWHKKNDEELEEQLRHVLHGGKGEKTRMYTFDQSLKESGENIKVEKKVEDQQSVKNIGNDQKPLFRKLKKKPKKELNNNVEVVTNSHEDDTNNEKSNSLKESHTNKDNQLWAVVAVGTLAAVIGILAGGRKNK